MPSAIPTFTPSADRKRLALAGGGGAPGFVASREHLARLRERRRVRAIMRDIHSGRWRRVLLDLQVTQFGWPGIQSHSGKIAELLVKVNLVRLAWKMHASVLVGTRPTVTVPEGFGAHLDMLSGLDRACALESLLHATARRMNVEAEAALRVDLYGGQTILRLDDNDRTFPVGEDGPDGQPTVWERRWVVTRQNAADPTKPKRYLRVERHRVLEGRGVVEQEAYETETGEVLADLTQLPRVSLNRAVEAPPPELVETGATRPLITRFVQDYYDGEPEFGVQEADLDLLDAATAAVTQLARAHAMHARPKVRVPEGMVSKRTGRVDLTTDAFVDPDKEYEYVRVEAMLTEMLEFMDRMLTLELVVLQMSPALVGSRLGGGATPDSYEKLRLEATNTLTYAKGSAIHFGPSLERALTTASEVDASLPLRGYPLGPISVRMHPELPKDGVERARELAEQRREGLIDQRTAIAILHGEEEADAIFEAVLEDREREARAQQTALFGAVPAGGAA